MYPGVKRIGLQGAERSAGIDYIAYLRVLIETTTCLSSSPGTLIPSASLLFSFSSQRIYAAVFKSYMLHGTLWPGSYVSRSRVSEARSMCLPPFAICGVPLPPNIHTLRPIPFAGYSSSYRSSLYLSYCPCKYPLSLLCLSSRVGSGARPLARRGRRARRHTPPHTCTIRHTCCASDHFLSRYCFHRQPIPLPAQDMNMAALPPLFCCVRSG